MTNTEIEEQNPEANQALILSQNEVIVRQRERIAQLEKNLIISKGHSIFGRITIHKMTLQFSQGLQKVLSVCKDQNGMVLPEAKPEDIAALIAKSSDELKIAQSEWVAYAKEYPEIAEALAPLGVVVPVVEV